MSQFDYLKPSLEKRVAWTFTKVQRVELLEKLRSIGVPLLKYVSRDKSFLPDIEKYTVETVIDKLVTMVIDQDNRIKELETAIGEEEK